MTETKARRYVSDFLTPSAVDACNRWADTPEYGTARLMVTGYARHYADADDVESVALVLLGDALDSGLRDSLAAGSAVKRAAQNLYAVAREALDYEESAGDTRMAYEGRSASYGAPDACATWRAADTVREVLEALDPASAQILMVGASDACQETRARHGVSAVKIAAAHGVRVTRGAASQVWADRYADARAEVAALTVLERALPAYVRGDLAPQSETDRSLPRWDDTATGPASYVVLTRPNGDRWVILPDRATLLAGDDAVRAVLSATIAPATDAPTVREVTAAALMAGTDAVTRTAGRPQGVAPGMRHGAHGIAGTGTPTPAPTPSRKRKRDGGIGAPMVPAR